MLGRVLIVDDDPDFCQLLAAGFRQHDLEVATSASASDALAALAVPGQSFDAVLTDLQMPGMDGIAFCQQVATHHPEIPVVVMTAFATLETAIAAIRADAYDFIQKPLHLEATAVRMQRVVRERKLRDEVKRLKLEIESRRPLVGIIGASPAMEDVFDLVDRVADTDVSVLITGETGTGKEVAARALHARGRRRDGPFVAVNCSAIPEGLFESELFGHVRGAFTDARTERPGLLQQAHGGTLFLDEIGDMPLAVQPKLLRALEERVIRPVGGNKEMSIDIRTVVATNVDLETAVAEGRFREDLFFRVNVIHVHLPPLRARGGDILLLAQHFLERFAVQNGKKVVGVQTPAAERLLAYSWPGNVRELRNCIERAVALTRYEQIAVEDLPEKIRTYERSHVVVASDDPSELLTMEEVEQRYIARVMEAVGGNKTLAAKVLGFDRKTLYRKLERYQAGGGA
ncbi:MAG: sigma-54 dependent transcriptional regulator [Nannocystaceae bacterium]